ncbi:similar to Saccharomyces cerevisiae YLR137W RKM5 Protein lysine methyltransferase [Maudiozyma saulgeensis]|uniref:Ribosomal lysine N-methyltransferase 5 n=1 Tax=Maudiozyma saulgeensis TaxID=1789683 RepID=A0A1X7R4U7_9SACH|nr:similar to Saccharomyces cerevisiae YLR137W RKM5 Protein lysine methyltransferase [Kazachstania saulgeensis]
MVFQLLSLDEDTLHEHIFERYVELERNSANLKQDLGIQSRTGTTIEIDIEPPLLTTATKTIRKKKKNKVKQNGSRTDIELYNVVVEQSLSDLNSSVSNNNSTTGYVLWSSTPFFLRWLLYNDESEPLRHPSESIKVVNIDQDMIKIPPIYSEINDTKVGIIELGTGISPLMAVILSNHVDYYICTDQRGILNKLKQNIKENISQISRRECISKSLEIKRSEIQIEYESDTIESNENKKRYNRASKTSTVSIEVEELDWEKFDISVNHPYLNQIRDDCDTIYIIAMDVIYNEYLIEPFLNTITNLRKYLSKNTKGTAVIQEVKCLIGVHLRSQDIVTEFLEQAIINHELPVYSISDSSLDASRYAFYLI